MMGIHRPMMGVHRAGMHHHRLVVCHRHPGISQDAITILVDDIVQLSGILAFRGIGTLVHFEYPLTLVTRVLIVDGYNSEVEHHGDSDR
ncbi:MAG TPA: hypothetical protein VNM90_28135 [Haliangium sp.]|nr:hypothetical protein [Haliangium sp.]